MHVVLRLPCTWHVSSYLLETVCLIAVWQAGVESFMSPVSWVGRVDSSIRMLAWVAVGAFPGDPPLSNPPSPGGGLRIHIIQPRKQSANNSYFFVSYLLLCK